jgi:hypothetical protein
MALIRTSAILTFGLAVAYYVLAFWRRGAVVSNAISISALRCCCLSSFSLGRWCLDSQPKSAPVRGTRKHGSVRWVAQRC